jgi:hypothetical protein
MIDITFSSSVKLLELNGFRSVYQNNITQCHFPFKIYIEPVKHVIVTLDGFENDQVGMAQMYFAWKPLNAETHKFILARAHVIYLPNIVSFFVNRDDFNPDYVGFPYAKSSNFSNIWEFYNLVLTNGNFVPWPNSLADPNISLLSTREKIAIKYGLTIGDLSNEEKNIRRIAEIKKLSAQRLRSIISDQNLFLTNFGLE